MKWSINFDTKFSLAPLRPKESNRELLLGSRRKPKWNRFDTNPTNVFGFPH